MAKIQMQRLAGLIVLIDEGLAALPDSGNWAASDFDSRRAERDKAVRRLSDELVRRERAIIRDGGLASLTIANLTASATAGLEGALRNWRRAARAKLDGELRDQVTEGAQWQR